MCKCQVKPNVCLIISGSLTSFFFPLLSSTGDSGKVTTVVATPGQGPDRPQEVSYTDIKVIGNGSFGVVYQARLIDTQEMVAIKKVLQDKRFKVRLDRLTRTDNYSEVNAGFSPCAVHSLFLHVSLLLLQNRELQIMRKLDHCNIVRLRYFFYSSGEKVCLH